MLDIGWTELLVIAVVLIVVVGPKDLPPMLRAFGKMTSKLRGMAGEFRQQFDEALKEADMEDVGKAVRDLKSLNPANTIREAMSPLRDAGNSIRSDLQKATSATAPKAEDPIVMPDPAVSLPSDPPPIMASPEPAPSPEPAKPEPAKTETAAAEPVKKPAARKPRAPAKAAPKTDAAAAKATPAKTATKSAAPKKVAAKTADADVAAAAPKAKAPAKRKTAATAKDNKKGDA
ncbi:Sec-independent protein translocase protein TatB [Rhizobium sp. PAMB 3182]